MRHLATLHESERPIVRSYLKVRGGGSEVRVAEELGATVILEPMETLGRRAIAIFVSEGVEQGIWQPL